jgi:hypothetical protein
VSAVHLLLWVALPYAATALFLAGHVWRYRTDQYGWTTRSTQILESRWLKWGSPLFHLGALAAIGGHVLGILIPTSWTETAGVSGDAYHAVSATAGTIAGVACAAGLVILVWRRAASPRVRVTTTRMDVLVYVLLGVVIGLGLAETVGRLRLPRDGGGLVPEHRLLPPRARHDGRRADPVPAARRLGLAHPGRVAVLAARPRLEHPAPVRRSSVHPVPAQVVAGAAAALTGVSRACS